MAKTNKEIAPTKSSSDEKLFKLITLNLIWLVPAIVVILSYGFFTFGQVTPKEIGQVGDFFGGWLTPIFTFVTILLLIFSIRFQIHELKITRQELKNSIDNQKQAAKAQQELFQQAKIGFELENSAHSLTQLVNDANKSLNVKVNQFVDIVNFDENSPNETRLFKLVDDWKHEVESGNPLALKVRNNRDSHFISNYVHTVHHIIYVCQSLAKNEGWVHVSPHIKSVSQHIDVLVTLYKVKLLNASDIWLIKQAVNGLHNKVEHIKNAGVVLDDEIIAKIVKENIKETLKSIPTPTKFQYQESTSEEEPQGVSEPKTTDAQSSISRLLNEDALAESSLPAQEVNPETESELVAPEQTGSDKS